MRVAPSLYNTKNNYLLEKTKPLVVCSNYTNKSIDNSELKANALYNLSFYGLFGVTLQDKVNAGVQAVDKHTLFVATNNSEKALFKLNHAIDEVKTPILDLYVLEDEKIGKSFCIFKNNDGYQFMSLDFLGSDVKVDGENTHVSSEETIKINNSAYVSKELLDINPIKIKLPEKIDKTEADKHLKHFEKFSDDKAVSGFNQAFLNNIFAKKEKDEKGINIIKYEDVGGIDGVIKTLQEKVICPLKYPQAFKNIRLNKGIILYGPPRCGKTLVGLATANEVDANFLYMNANEMTSALVGESEKNWRKLFSEAKAKQPCIIFIDEFDSIAKPRTGSENARHDDKVVNQLLGLMSDLEKSNDNIFIIAATNRLDLVDEALKSSGRFGLHLKVDLPDEKGIEQIFDIHAKNQPIEDCIDRTELFQKMFEAKFTGSDVAETISNAYHNALLRNNLYEKMLNDTIQIEEINGLKINNDDLLKAVNELAEQKRVVK